MIQRDLNSSHGLSISCSHFLSLTPASFLSRSRPHSVLFSVFESIYFITLWSTSSLIQLMNVEKCLVSCFRYVDLFSVKQCFTIANKKRERESSERENMRKGDRECERETEEDLFDCDNHLRRNLKWERVEHDVKMVRTLRFQWVWDGMGDWRNEINIHFHFGQATKTESDGRKKCSHRYSNFKLIFSLSLFLFRRRHRRHCCCTSFCFVSIHFINDVCVCVCVFRVKRVCGNHIETNTQRFIDSFSSFCTDVVHYWCLSVNRKLTNVMEASQ